MFTARWLCLPNWHLLTIYPQIPLPRGHDRYFLSRCKEERPRLLRPAASPWRVLPITSRALVSAVVSQEQFSGWTLLGSVFTLFFYFRLQCLSTLYLAVTRDYGARSFLFSSIFSFSFFIYFYFSLLHQYSVLSIRGRVRGEAPKSSHGTSVALDLDAPSTFYHSYYDANDVKRASIGVIWLVPFSFLSTRTLLCRLFVRQLSLLQLCRDFCLVVSTSKC